MRSSTDYIFLEIAMQRNYHTNYSCFQNHQDLKLQTAFHEAGHAASIYLGNKNKQLPLVFFQIQIRNNANSDSPFFAKVIDGRLIQNLPIAGLDIHNLTKEERRIYQYAYEADIINLLVGPLAEAKYVSIRDDEAFNFNLLNAHALNYYGGSSSDVEKAYSYLKFFIASEKKREEKMLELCIQAYLFIWNRQNWNCILNLAHYILDSKKDILSCEEAMEVFDQSLV